MKTGTIIPIACAISFSKKLNARDGKTLFTSPTLINHVCNTAMIFTQMKKKIDLYLVCDESLKTYIFAKI